MKRRTILQALAAFFASLFLSFRNWGRAVPKLVARPFNGGVSALARWRPVVPHVPTTLGVSYGEPPEARTNHIVMEMLRPARSAPVRLSDDEAFRAAIQDAVPLRPYLNEDPVVASVACEYAHENGYSPEVFGIGVTPTPPTERDLEYERQREEGLREFLARVKSENA